MKLGKLIPARFVRRVNRFLCLVKLGKEEKGAVLRNTGRLNELLHEGREVYIRSKTTGKYRYELVLAKTETGLVCLDSHMPPSLLIEYMHRTGEPWRCSEIKREFKVGSSRFDLLIDKKILVETKSVNLVKNSVALFPDAPTERGTKHIRELMKLSTRFEPALVFIVQRQDATYFSPNYRRDPQFAEVLKRFYDEGFTVKAFLCKVSLRNIEIYREIPVII